MKNKDLKSDFGLTTQRSTEDADPKTDPPILVEASVPETSTPTSCKACGTTDPPDEDGLCPTPKCRKFRASNTVALVHGARRKFTASMIERRDAHAAALFAERGGRAALDVITQFNVIEFADLTVQYEDVTAYLMDAGTLTQAGRERAAVKHALDISARRERVGALLQGHAPPEPRSATDYSAMTEDQLIERLETLLTHAVEMRDAKIERAQPRLDAAVVVADGVLLPEPSDLGHTEQEVTRATAIHKPAPAPACVYCGGPCVGKDRDMYRTLHALDPEEVARRTQEENEDAIDQQIAHAQGWPTSRMIAKAEARQARPTEEEQRQAALRSKLGWDAGSRRV